MIHLVIPGIPPSVNTWRNLHHFAEAKQKREWEDIVGWEVARQRVRPPKPLKRAHVTYEYYFSSKRRHDPDNYVGKWTTDGLVKAGVLEDDSFDNIALLICQGGVDRKNPRTEIFVEEVEEKEETWRHLLEIEDEFRRKRDEV